MVQLSRFQTAHSWKCDVKCCNVVCGCKLGLLIWYCQEIEQLKNRQPSEKGTPKAGVDAAVGFFGTKIHKKQS